MNISIVQYRIAIGLHNNFKIKNGQTCAHSSQDSFLWLIFDLMLRLKYLSSPLNLIIFFSIINFIFDRFAEIVTQNTFYIRPQTSDSIEIEAGVPNYFIINSNIDHVRILLSSIIYCILVCFLHPTTSAKQNKGKINYIVNKLLCKKRFFERLINMYSFWLVIMNFILITLTVPNIINPGPLDGLSVLYLNARGFVNFKDSSKSNDLFTSKIKDFHGHIYSSKPDVVILNETWLKKPILNSEIFPNNSYKVFRRDRSVKSHPPDNNYPDKFKKNGGGVIIAIKSNLEAKSTKYKISACGAAKAEILSVVLEPESGSTVCITTLYRVGTLGAENLAEVKRHMTSLIRSKPKAKHIFVGDFNLSQTSWPEGITSCNNEKGFVDLFQDLNFDQLIGTPTHKDGKVLDLLLCNQPNVITDIAVQPRGTVCSSDHNSIIFNVKVKCKRLKSPKRKIYNMKKADFKSINCELNKINWEYILDFNCVNKSLDKFEDIFFSICDKFIPKVVVKSSFQPPWFDSELDTLCKKKVKLLDKKKHTNDPNTKLQINEEIKSVRKLFRNKVDLKKMANVINDDDPALIKKKFWSFYKSTSNTTRIPETMKYGTKIRSKNSDVANLFNKYFSDQFSNPGFYDIDIDFQNDPLSDFQFSEDTVFDLLKRTNLNKAAGPDKFDSALLKYCAKGLSRPLSFLFNKIFLSGKIPDKWKMANVVPVHKKGDKSSVTNYRPISLTCLPMKILEYCIKDLLLAKCGNLIKDKQHGFCKDKSCLTQLLPYVDKLSIALNNKSRIDSVYFDFSKAFDSVNHDLILFKLKNYFGIDGLLLQFFRDYLYNRKQRVAINGSLSGLLDVASGVPQGSILGPLLFILFIDDICDEINDGTEIALYADDTKIWREILCDEDQVKLQNDINNLFKWSVRNLMNFHPDKCNVVAFTNKPRIYPLPFYEFWYSLNGKDLDYVKNEKDLGVVIDSKLSWNRQCQMLESKATKQFNLLRRTCYFISNSNQRRILYLTLVRSIFEHCCQVWSPQNSTSLDMLEKLQKRAVKWILREQHESYTDIIFLQKQKGLDLLPVKHRFLFSDLVLFYRILNEDVNIDLPYYISKIEPHNVKNITRHSKPMAVGKDNLIYKSSIQPKVKAFKDSYFFRTVKNWNLLPFELRSTGTLDNFKVNLKEHMWLILGLEPD